MKYIVCLMILLTLPDLCESSLSVKGHANLLRTVGQLARALATARHEDARYELAPVADQCVQLEPIVARLARHCDEIVVSGL